LAERQRVLPRFHLIPSRNPSVVVERGYVTPEIVAVDWIRVVNGAPYTGDGKQNSDWPDFGAPVYAVANGTVVSTVNNKPDIPPFEKIRTTGQSRTTQATT
jgi:hypothetical protein